MAYLFGVDYYPEHWPRERWPIDAKMMREAGITIVRMAEFSWAKWEPREGEFHFEDLDETIEILAREGIRCILGTPSAAPPAWIVRKNPEIQPVDSTGRRLVFGGRHHDCQSSEVYRAHIRRFVSAFAAHYAKNPNVVGWQVDNELGNSHEDLCHCPSCEARFRGWLREKYGTIDELNRRWGTAFWSQNYADFDEIESPKLTVTGHNPSHELDWKRFCSDLILDFHKMQADILRAAAPGKFITHNLMGFYEKFDYCKLGEQLDFASHDQYPGGHFLADQSGRHIDRDAAQLAFIRSVMGKPFWIMEQQSAITGWEILGRTPPPGRLALWAMQSIAHGADTVIFFRWRSCVMGTEQYWHGLLPHSGVPGRYFREVTAFMKEQGPLLEQIQGAMPKNDVGILFSYVLQYAFRIQPHHPDLDYVGHLLTYYAALMRAHIPADFVHNHTDWTRYKVLIAPLQFLMTPELAAKLHAYAEQGGTLVLDMRCGVKDGDNIAISDDELPCRVRDLCGLTVTEFDCLRDCDVAVDWDGERYAGKLWSDLIEPDGAQVLARYASEFYAGTPVITRNAFGKGTVYYVGTQMDAALADRFARELAAHAGLMPLIDAGADVEAVCREKDGKAWLFVMNHTAEKASVRVDGAWTPVDGEREGVMEPYSFRVYAK